jgi:ribosomal protein L11 methyltransferase
MAVSVASACSSFLTVVFAEIPRGCADPLAEALAAEGLSAAVWEDHGGGPDRIEVFLERPAAAGAAAAALKRAGAACGLVLRPRRRRLPARDWRESWKRFFRATRVSPRLVVCPPWEDRRPEGGERVVVIEPGMSFGTGLHATTRSCLRMLDELAAGGEAAGDVLDLGCGSGILAIAACKLGFGAVRGIDNDPEAVRAARANAVLNGVRAEFRLAGLEEPAGVPPAGIVVANILAETLCRQAPAVAAAVRPVRGHALILSGILATQYRGVAATYERLGFEEVASLPEGEWLSGRFARRRG